VPELEPEVLSRDGRTPWRRGVVAACLGALLVVGLPALVVDHSIRGREDRALDACATRARETFTVSSAPMDAMASYVRPALLNGPTARLRRGMYALVSEQAAGADVRLTEVARGCRRIDVWWAHAALRTRREACLRALDEGVAFLREVARNGREAFRGHRPQPPDC
jgi:hypothetical protein